ncbi:MAG: hypothetical protein ACFFBC_15290 [Promethearchaeota archaeon]
MRKEGNSESLDDRSERNGNKKYEEGKSVTPEEIYAAKSFIRNLSRSMGKDPSSLYPEKATKIFKINNLVDLRLINNKTYIYIDNKRFVQCFNVLFNIGAAKGEIYEDIINMDEATRRLRGGYSGWFTRITPNEEFMAHCSNIQAFFENDLNTDILHSDIAFPLLKKLVRLGYKPAEEVFNKQIIKRYNEGTWETRRFLKSEGYLKYLNREEKRTLKKEKPIETYTYTHVPKPREGDIERILVEYYMGIEGQKKKSIRIFKYDDEKIEFKEVDKKFPLSTLLNSDKILLFDDPMRGKVWIWHGFNTTTRMRYYAKKLAPKVRERYGIGFKVISVDEGLEPIEFTDMVSVEEEPEDNEAEDDLGLFKSLSREQIRLLLLKFQLREAHAKEIEIDGKKFSTREIRRKLGSEIQKTRDIPKGDLNQFFKLVDEGVTKLKLVMKEQSVDVLTFHRQYLPEMFDKGLLLISERDGYPIFKPEVLEYFEFMGILTIKYGNVIKFLKFGQDKVFFTT